MTTTSAPRRSSSPASPTAYSRGRVTTIRRPVSGCSGTDGLQDLESAGRERLARKTPPDLDGLPLALDAHDVAPVRARRRAPARCTCRAPCDTVSLGVSSACAYAPTGAVQPESSSRRNSRSAAPSARARGVVHASEQLQHGLVVRAALDGERALPGRGDHGLGVEPLGDLGLEPEAPHPRCREDGGVELPLPDLANARVHVPANRTHFEVVAHPPNLGRAPEAARPDDCPRRGARRGRRPPARRGSPAGPRAGRPPRSRCPEHPPSAGP